MDKSLSLVVMRSPYQVIKTKDILTMTGLKKLSGAYISSTYLRRPSFAAELFKELSRIPEGKIKEGDEVTLGISKQGIKFVVNPSND